MAWTVPKTFVANAALTSSELNIYLRDNMLELNVAKSSSAMTNAYFITDGPNSQIARLYDKDAVTTEQLRTSVDYGDLNTVGPICTVTSGAICLVIMTALMRNETTNASSRMSFEISGATELEATDNYALCAMTNASAGGGAGTPSYPMQFSHFTWVDGLTPGENTFTAKYRVGVEGAVGHFQVRRLIVFPWS